jgi:nucleotide-binding universal stress UspA family protein
MPSSIRTITHPTDLSDASMDAFAHALRIALLAKSRFDIVNVVSAHDQDIDAVLPQVRHTLSLWGLMNENDPPSAVAERLHISVRKVDLSPQDPISGLLAFLRLHQSDFLVLATHGREGLTRWLHGSIAETLARRAETPALFITPDARGFVNKTSGVITLKRVLLPVDHEPSPGPAVRIIADFMDLFGKANIELRLMHVGSAPPIIPPHYAIDGTRSMVLRSGHPVDAILNEAVDWRADLVAMPTAGHSRLQDAVGGSTSERVLRHAPCPVLTVPACYDRF